MTHVDLQTVLSSWRLDPSTVPLFATVACAAVVYLGAAARPSPRGRRWPRARTAWFLAALALFAFIYGSGLQTYEDDPTVHVVQHMLSMMAFPALLALAAPVTLLLRTLPIGARRAIVRELKGAAFRPLTGRWAPVLLCVDYYLTMFLYQLTPVHSFAEQHALAHLAVHQYFLACGLLFWLPVAGVDPVRHRPTRRTKLAMIWTGLPAFALLGAIELAKGDAATGWAYIVCGAALTIAAAIGTIERTQPVATAWTQPSAPHLGAATSPPLSSERARRATGAVAARAKA